MAVQGGLKASRPPTTSRLGHCSLLLAPCSCLILSAWSVAPSPPRPHFPARAHPILRNSVPILIVAAPTTTTPRRPKQSPTTMAAPTPPRPPVSPDSGPTDPNLPKLPAGWIAQWDNSYVTVEAVAQRSRYPAAAVASCMLAPRCAANTQTGAASTTTSRSAPASRNGTCRRVKRPLAAATTAHPRRTRTPTTSRPAQRDRATLATGPGAWAETARRATARWAASP